LREQSDLLAGGRVTTDKAPGNSRSRPYPLKDRRQVTSHVDKSLLDRILVNRVPDTPVQMPRAGRNSTYGSYAQCNTASAGAH
jgi:hypothetical protein